MKKAERRPSPIPALSGERPGALVRRRILLVDDHPFMRAGLAQLIDRQPDLVVCGEAGSPAEAMLSLSRLKPDLVLTDLTMPGRGGLEFIKDILAAEPHLPVLVVSMHDELVYAERVLRAGARGYIMKEAGGDNLLAAVRQVLNGDVHVSPQITSRILNALSDARPRGSSSPIQKLTDREFEIFQLIGNGRSTREIASQLHLSSKTIDVHRSHIKQKLGLKDVTALVRHAVRWVETGGRQG